MTAPEGSLATVLIADDDALVRGVLRMALSRAGYAVVEAADAPTAIAAAAEHSPRLVVLDINMPGGTLPETLGTLRAQHPAIAVLVLSGESSAPRDLDGPLADFARKPIELDDLLDRVRRLVDPVTDPQ